MHLLVFKNIRTIFASEFVRKEFHLRVRAAVELRGLRPLPSTGHLG